jgi:hypothetical protein
VNLPALWELRRRKSVIRVQAAQIQEAAVNKKEGRYKAANLKAWCMKMSREGRQEWRKTLKELTRRRWRWLMSDEDEDKRRRLRSFM